MKTIRIAAALLLRDNGDTLLVRKRGTRAFMQPGGKIEPGETPAAALARELHEEIGLTVDPATMVPMGRFEASAAHEPGHSVVADVFRLDIGSAELRPAAEIEEIRWVSPLALGDLAMAPLTEHHILPFHRRQAAGAILDDLLRPGLRLVICGTAAGTRSAMLGAYYAGPGNKFWKTMHEIGLTPERIAPQDWRTLDCHDIGFTDLAKAHYGMDAQLPVGSFDPERLRAAIRRFEPETLAFNGKTAARIFHGRQTIDYGPQERFGRTTVWVLPSTSGAASGAWSIAPWRAMAESLRTTEK